MSEKVNLFWFSKQRLQNINIKNFGDDLNPFLIKKITGKDVIWKNPKSQNIVQSYFTRINLAVGSILHFATNNCNIWGSGLIDSNSEFPTKANYFAVRGPQTYKILKQKGCKVNAIYGDPALLLPRFLEIKPRKKYVLGIIPHYTEIDNILAISKLNSDEVKLINLQNDCFEIIEDLLACERILSSSLHGIIVAMAYGIPVKRIQLSDNIYGDGIKYNDFYESVGIKSHSITKIDIKNASISNLLKLFTIDEREMFILNDLINIQDKLLSVKPF